MFNFNMDYNKLPGEVQKAWSDKCYDIADKAIQVLCKKHNLKYSVVKDILFLDEKAEWEEGDTDITDDVWVDSAVQSFEMDLREWGYISP